jgi:hypothetical protein
MAAVFKEARKDKSDFTKRLFSSGLYHNMDELERKKMKEREDEEEICSVNSVPGNHLVRI